MLGMDNGTNPCSCKCTGACDVQGECECIGYCKDYQELYDEIAASNRRCWLTISPKPHEFEVDADKVIDWLSDIYELRKCSDKMIVVVEYTTKMIMHFHIFIKITDMIKFKKGFIQRWYYTSNIEPIYGRNPAKGIHYLFKSVTSVAELLTHRVHFDFKSLKDYVKKNPSLRRQLS